MLRDVTDAINAAGSEAVIVSGPGGQGEDVLRSLATLRGPVTIVNGDVPCVTSDEVEELTKRAPAIVAARDGTTNALSMSDPSAFAPLYGPGSAERFAAHLHAERLALPGLRDDDETWDALASADGFGGESWFKLGDRDIGLHLVRTQALRAGEPLSHVTARIATAVGVETTILPATDDRLRTWVETPSGTFSFQQWFVARAHRHPVDRLRFEGSADAKPAPGVLDALHEADAILIPPSNPYLSIGPILAVERIRRAIERRRVPCVAVSPLIGGRAVM